MEDGMIDKEVESGIYPFPKSVNQYTLVLTVVGTGGNSLLPKIFSSNATPGGGGAECKNI